MNWTTGVLTDLGTVARGRSRHRPRNDPALYGGEFPFFQTGDIKAAELWLTAYSDTYNRAGLAQSRLWPVGTLAITIAANIAESAILGVPGCFPDSVVGFTPTPDRSDVVFVKYLLDYVRHRFQSISRGTTQDNLSVEKLLSVEVQYPPLPTQRKIASILLAYDDLIENNNRRIKLLEEMAQRIYREWFVDFRYPGHERVPVPELDDGQIPDGWEMRPLVELAGIVMGQSPPSRAYNETRSGLPFHQGVGTYGEHFPITKVYSSEGTRLAREGDILISVRAPVGRINVADTELILGRGLCGVRGTSAPTVYLLYALKHIFREEDSMGGGSIFKAVTRKDVETLLVCRPDHDALRRFAEVIQPMVSLLETLVIATRGLREARDVLLPRLISGEMDVEELDIAFEEPAA